jgi:hypothetical protein
MITDFIVKWQNREESGYAYFRTFSCPLEMYLFRVRHSISNAGAACCIAY